MKGKTENERVKLIRKSEKVNLTLERFGEKMGVTKGAMSAIETGKRAVTDQMRRSICREFHVNEEWLLTGEGEMFSSPLASEISALAERYGLDEADQTMLLEYARLDPADRKVIKDYLRRTFFSLQKEDPAAAEDAVPPETTVDGMTREEYHAKVDSEFDAREKRKGKDETEDASGIA